MGNSVRTNITIPAELKMRMDAVSHLVNWSAVARQAFEQRLAEIVTEKRKVNMEEAIARLRVSKAKHRSQLYKEGLRTGKAWAKSRAEADELTLLSDLRERAQPRSEWEGCFTDDPLVSEAYSAAERFYFMIRPDYVGDRGAAFGFWSTVVNGKMPAGEFVHGFADGALAVWDGVRDQL
jgi:hypothetical protein